MFIAMDLCFSKSERDAEIVLPEQDEFSSLDKAAAARRFRAADALYRSAWELKLAWLRRCHPGLPEGELRRMVREVFLHASG